MRNKLFLLIMFAFVLLLSAQEEDKIINVAGDSLKGRTVNGESIREVIGNVVITQGDIRITCNKTIQNITKNNAELIGDVIVFQDTVTIKTDRGFYFGDTKSAVSESGLVLSDGHMDLSAKRGRYFFDEKKASFADSVVLVDSSNTLRSNFLDYYNDINKAVAVGDVSVSDTASILFADSLIHFRDSEETFGFKNIKIKNRKNDVTVFGNFLTDFGKKNFTKVTGNSLLIQIDTLNSGELDTLIISADSLVSLKDTTSKFIAYDSVKIFRKDFASVNDYSLYYRDLDYIFTYKKPEDQNPPVLWYEDSQLAGDSVFIYLKDDELDWIDIRDNGFILSKIENYEYRYDQISGKNIKMYFGEEGLNNTIVEGNLLSIYYLFDESKPNGLIKSSAENGKVFFEDNKIVDVRLYNSPASEYHPENLVKGSEKTFTLPTFIIYENKPIKEELLKNRKF